MRVLQRVFLVAFFPTALAAAVWFALSWHLSREAVLARQRSESRALLDAMRQQASSHFTGVRAVLEVETRRLLPGAPEVVLAELRGLEERLGPAVDGIFLNLPDGEVRGTRGERFSSRDRYYYPLLRRGTPLITRIITSKASGRPSVVVLTPRMGPDGTYLGGLGASVPVSSLLQAVRDFVPPNVGRALLVDETGRVEASGGASGVAPEVVARVLAAQQGEGELTVGGVPNQLFFAAVPGTPWKLVLLRPQRRLLPVQRQMLLASALILLATLAMGWVGYRLLHGMLSRPIQRLLAAQAALGQGERSVRVESVGHDEFATLTASFNAMAEQLQRSEEELRHHEQVQTAIAANIPGVVFRFTVDPDGTMGLSFVAEHSQELLGIPARPYETFLDRLLEHIDAEQRTAFMASIEEAVRERRPWTFEGALRLAAGDERWFHGRSLPISSGDQLVFDGFLLDITEHKQAEEALRESEQQLQAVFDLAPYPCTVSDRQGRYLMVNQAFVNSLGIEPAAVIGRTAAELGFVVAPEAEAGALAELERCGGFHSLEMDIAVGSQRAIVLVSSRLITFAGQPAVLTVSVDISAQKRVERALAESEVKFRALYENAGDAIFIMDGDTVVDCNSRALALFGVTEEGIRGGGPLDYSPELQPDGRASAARAAEILEGLNRGEPQSFEWTHLRSDGTPFPAEVDLNPIVISGRPHVQAVVRDVTARKAAEQALREQQQMFTDIVESSLDWIWTLDLSGHHTYSNHAVELILGYSPEEVANLGLDLLHPEDRSVVAAKWPVWVQERRGWQGEVLRWRARDGSYRLLESTAVPIIGPEGDLQGFRGVDRDITDRQAAEQALRESEEKFSRAFAHAPLIVALSDLETDAYTDVSDEAVRITGYSRQEMLGRTAVELGLMAPEEASRLMSSLQASGRVQGMELTVRCKDGRALHCLLSADVLRVAGRPQVLSLALDISERKQAEEALQFRNVLLTTQQEASIDGILVVDEAGRILSHNQRFVQMWGVPEELVAARDDGPVLQSVTRQVSDADAFVARVHYLYEHSQETSRDELRLTDGRVFDRYSAPMLGPEGRYYGRVWYFRDITEAKRAEEELTRVTALLQAAIEQTPAGMLIADAPDVTIRLANPAALGIRGESTELLTGIPVELHPSHWLTFWPDGTPVAGEDLPLSRAVLKGETVRNEEVIIRRRDGEPRHVLANAAPVRNAQGEVIAGVVVFPDITELKRAEDEKEKLQSQLVQAQKMESVGRLAGGVAHDFNNLLGVILMYADLALRRMAANDPVRAYLEEVRKAARRSADLTGQLLAFARKQTVTPRVIDLNETVEAMLKMLRRLIGEDIHLVWLPGAELAPVYIDPSQVDQILANLSVNARDAITGTGRLTIETSKVTFDETYCAQHPGAVPGEYVLLAVSDDGCGMDRETLASIFEPFFTTKETGKGTGLGLATVHGIVKQNRGFIDVYSEPGRGTTFRLYLPRHRSATTPQAEASSAAAPPRGSETILLVEDEPAVLEAAALILGQLGYAVLPAPTPGEALRLAREHAARIDLLMTDVVMPDMNGRDLAGNVRSIHPAIKCLFMSGYTDHVIGHQGLLDEGMHFVQKPFSIEEVALKVRAALDAAGRETW